MINPFLDRSSSCHPQRRSRQTWVATTARVAKIFVLACAMAFVVSPISEADAAKDWNVLLLTFDTTRADWIGCYGRENATTPVLDALAADGVLFENNFSSNPVTQAAHSTIMTGVYPMMHGVRDNTYFKLPPERETLAETLQKQGWATGAAIGGFPLVKEFGLAQGFDFYDDDITGNREDFMGRPAARRSGTWYDERPAAHVNGAILPWLREHIEERFFVWLHYWDPHLPHIAPPPYNELYAHDTYSGEIAYADQSLGTIVKELRRAGVYDRTIIIMTSDHGDSFDEHREATHAFLAYGSSLHVPLIMHIPEFEGDRRVKQRVSTVDIVPTVLDLLGVKGPEELQGRSLVPLIEDPKMEMEPPAATYSESMSPRLSHGFGELRALYDGDLKYIHGPRPELFDLANDPNELEDLVAARPDDAAQMMAKLETFIVDHASSEAVEAMHEVDDEMAAQLEALGYLDSTDGTDKTVEEKLRSDGGVPQDHVGDINLSQQLRQQLGAGQFSTARRTAERLVKASPENGFYRASLANALLGLGKPAEAAEVVEGAQELGGAHQAVFLQVAKAVFEAGERDSQRGLALAERIAAAEDSAAAHMALAQMARDQGDDETFTREVENALSIDDENTAAHLALGAHQVDTGKLDEAERHVRAALTAEPMSLVGQLTWAKLLARRGETATALDRVRRLVRLSPGGCEPRLEEVRWLLELDRLDDAKRALVVLERKCGDEEIRDQARKLLEGK
ncbi:MAG: arylsulfatase A-like enzyme/tetratricopeptide (TPR) repeat protein [Hyphomicrobiaceae bacterium]|jgi:arylsulfatase A-like enzyme/tetratricopeptide (TPR) repeat protein